MGSHNLSVWPACSVLYDLYRICLGDWKVWFIPSWTHINYALCIPLPGTTSSWSMETSLGRPMTYRRRQIISFYIGSTCFNHYIKYCIVILCFELFRCWYTEGGKALQRVRHVAPKPSEQPLRWLVGAQNEATTWPCHDAMRCYVHLCPMMPVKQSCVNSSPRPKLPAKTLLGSPMDQAALSDVCFLEAASQGDVVKLPVWGRYWCSERAVGMLRK